MDYTRIPRFLIFRDRESLDQYSVDKESYMDWKMFDIIQDSKIISLDDAASYVLDIFNTAYYITTLILLEPRPILYIRRYLDIADRIGISQFVSLNTYHRYFQAMTLAMVCNYLRVLNPRHLDWMKFEKKFQEHCLSFPLSQSDSDARFLYINNILSEMDAHTFAIYPQHFEPRPIHKAIKECEDIDIALGFPYIKERICKLPKDESFRAIEDAKGLIEEPETYDDGVYSDYMTTADARNILQELDDLKVALSVGSSIPLEDNELQLPSSEPSSPASSPLNAELQSKVDSLLKTIRQQQATIDEQAKKIAELEEQIDFFQKKQTAMTRRKDQRTGLPVGLTRDQVAVFGKFLADELHFDFDGFKGGKGLGFGMFSQFIWGYSAEKIRQAAPQREDKQYVASIFGPFSPDLAKKICDTWTEKVLPPWERKNNSSISPEHSLCTP